jgi:hypothetical protein
MSISRQVESSEACDAARVDAFFVVGDCFNVVNNEKPP